MLHRLRFLIVILLGICSLAGYAQQVNTAKLDSLLAALAANHKMMGSLALSHDGHVVYQRAFGAQQLAGTASTPATAATRYRIGSVSKMFTATMIMQLIEEKKLALATPLATFFPQLPNASLITVDQLLSHRSGLHDFTTDAAFPRYLAQPKTRAEMLTLIGQAPSDFAPGTKFAYSNANYVVLGYIVEELSRMPYAQALHQRVAVKAGLKNTYYGGKINPQNHEALSYEAAGTGWQPAPETDASIAGGAGALVSTPADLARFLEALFGGRLVSAASLNAMETVRDGYGRGMFPTPFDAKRGYGHNGRIDGFATLASYFPGEKLAVALCTNAAASSIDAVLIGALRIYFQQPYRIPDFRPFVLAPTDLDRWAGTYASTAMPLRITLTKAGATLQAQATGQGPLVLEPVGQGVFTFDQAGIRMEFDPTGPFFTLKQGGRSSLFTKE